MVGIFFCQEDCLPKSVEREGETEGEREGEGERGRACTTELWCSSITQTYLRGLDFLLSRLGGDQDSESFTLAWSAFVTRQPVLRGAADCSSAVPCALVFLMECL